MTGEEADALLSSVFNLVGSGGKLHGFECEASNLVKVAAFRQGVYILR